MNDRDFYLFTPWCLRIFLAIRCWLREVCWIHMEEYWYGKPAFYYKFVCFILLCKRCHVLGFYKKVRNNNSIFLMTQLDPKPSCFKHLWWFFKKQLTVKRHLTWSYICLWNLVNQLREAVAGSCSVKKCY